MKRNLLLTMIAAASLSAAAQSDVSEFFMTNNGFDTNFNYGAELTGNIAGDIINQIYGWQNESEATYTVAGTFAYNPNLTFNSSNALPAKGYNNSEGGALGLTTGWGNELLYTQEVTLPKGTYSLQSAYYNVGSAEAGKSLLAWLPSSGTAVTSKVNKFAIGEWTVESLDFTLSKETTGKIRIGFASNEGVSSHSQAKILVDFVNIVCSDIDKSILSDALTEARAVYGQGTGTGAAELKTAIDNAQTVFNNASADVRDILLATSNLKTAMRNYQLINASASNPLDMTSSIVNNSFESGMSGWNNNGFKTQTNIYFPLKNRDTYAEKWVNRGQQVGSGSVSQTITGLPNGKYLMSAAAGNIQQNGAESSENSGDQQTGAYLYAGFSRQPVTDIKVYDNIAFSVIDGTVTLGFAAENASGNWLTLDNFSLKYVGKNTAADLKAYLNAYIEEIRNFMTEAHVQSFVKDICNETISDVQDDLNDQLTEEKAILDKGNLDWAYEQLKISAKKYAKLSKAIEYATKVTEWYADEPAKIAPLVTAIETAKAQYADLSLTDEGFFLAISELEKVTKTVDKGFYTAEWSMGNVQDPNNKYYVGRTRQSKNWILFWEKEYGEDPETFICGNYTLDIDEVLRRADIAFDFYTDVLKYIKRGNSNTDNLKMVIRLRYEPTEWEASGSGIDDKIGLLTLTPWATPSRNWQTLYHEIGHCFQYQVHCDNKNTNGWMYAPGNGKGCAFWEQCAQWQAYKIMPDEQFTNEWFSGYLANVHKHILHESPRYNNYFVQDYWTYLHGIEFMGRLWNESKYPEDAVEAYMRITGISVSEFYDEMYDCAARFATWDIPDLEKYGKSKIVSRPQPSMSKTEDSGWRINASVAPENTGHNIIRLNKPSEAKLVAATFRGLNNAEGYRVKNADQAEWRYGFVAELKDGQRIYGPMGKSDYNNPEGKIWLECPDNVNRLWFIVSGGSKKYWRQVWDDNDNNDEQWPYEVVFHNTNKSGAADNIGVDGIFDIEEAPELPELVFDGKMLTIGAAEKNYTVVITDLTGYTVAKVNTADVAQTVTLNSGVYIINTLNADGERVETRKVLSK